MTQPSDRPPDHRTANANALARIAKERGWPDELARRMIELKLTPSTLDTWGWFGLSAEQASAQLKWYERLTQGDLRGRDAEFTDNDAFAALWADSPEEIGEWEVIVERGPDAFAQFKLQENVQLPILALGNEIIACCGFSRRNVLIQARRVSVVYGQALRVRRAYQRKGYGDQVRRLDGPPASGRPAIGQYDLMRTQNFAVVNWWKKFVPASFADVPEREGAVPGVTVSISQFPAQAIADLDPRIRPAQRGDLAVCAELINRTHTGMDLFRPYSADALENVLDEGFWNETAQSGANPAVDWWKSVYRWHDYFVVKDGNRILACGGLWDRGRDLRERWRRRGSDEERVVAIAAVLDFGFAEGAEEAMAALLRRFIGRAHELGRDYLAVPIDHLPKLAERTEALRPEPDTRALRWTLKEPAILHPYTDLRYW
jgi:hypothetical protein